MPTFNLYLKDKKSSEETQLYLQVSHDYKKVRIFLPHYIKPNHWQSDKSKKGYQRAKTNSFVGYNEFNRRIDLIIQRIKEIYHKYLNDNDLTEPDLKQLKVLIENDLKNKKEEKVNLFSFFNSFIETIKPTYEVKSVKWYENTLRVLKLFQKEYNRVIDFDTVDMHFYDDYINYLTITQNYAINTVGKHIQNLKAVMNDALKKGVHDNLSFNYFKKPKEESYHIYLNEEELSDLYFLDLSENTRLEKVRDLFMIGCYTGLRFSDFNNLKKENFINGFIEVKSKKTGIKVTIPIHPRVREIMQKYKSEPNSLPPSISDTKMREYIKEVCSLVPKLHQPQLKAMTIGGKKTTKSLKKYEMVGTHTARRSFATNQYLMGIPSITLMAITGHKTEKAFLTYIKVDGKQHAEIIQNLWKEKMESSVLRVV